MQHHVSTGPTELMQHQFPFSGCKTVYATFCTWRTANRQLLNNIATRAPHLPPVAAWSPTSKQISELSITGT